MYFRLLVTMFSLLMYAGLASAAPFAYIANSGGNSVTVIDTGAVPPVATATIPLPTPSYPYAVAVSPNGVHAYVTCQDSLKIAVIDTATNTVVKTLNTSLKPGGLAVNAAETRLYVADNNNNTLTVIDVSKLFDTGAAAEVAKVTLDSKVAVSVPEGVVINAAGNTVYVANAGTGKVAVVNANDVTDVYTKAGEIALDPGDYPMGMALSPDGAKLYAANFNSGSVAVIDTATRALKVKLSVATAPVSVAVNPVAANKFAYTPSSVLDKVTFINTGSTPNDTVLTTPAPVVGSQPWGAAVTPDGSKLYIVNYQAGTVSVLDAVTGSVLNSVPVGVKPTSMGNFMSPAYPYVVNASIDATGTGTGTVAPGVGAIPVTAYGRSFYFTPAVGSVVDSVTLNGVAKGAGTSIDITNITANQTLVVKFATAASKNVQPLTVELMNLGGRVYTTPTGIDITSGIMTAEYPTASQVTINADFTQYPGRSIASWGGACAGVSPFVSSCTVTLNAATNVQITFQNKPPQDKVMIAETGAYIGTIGAALQAAANGQTIKVVKNYDTLYLVDNIVANYSTAQVTLSGGWDDMGFATRTAGNYTRLGSLTIQSNAIVADMIVIQ
ncbi:beta-propeller fold lactonase family protein [Geobacter argillaceus]|uniref:YVTN family beta-propeller protein n=1 Tax=Geobacter argillaceus TaxID=345631 RepID=A0A562WU75_9BACT|nr:beta-propeller fold lactonase family protein [Geobacter argillaceus]TWJ33053.1 YVTN family beta-propeller protein [Geobacter argillaceus]